MKYSLYITLYTFIIKDILSVLTLLQIVYFISNANDIVGNSLEYPLHHQKKSYE